MTTPRHSAADLREQATSNIGIVRMTALRRWADATSSALGCEVRLYGSALVTKDWRDLDIALQWQWPETKAGDAWWWLCHAFSIAATQEIGAPVEVHLHTDPMTNPPVSLLLAAPKETADA